MDITQDFSFSVWLVSLNMMLSRSIHVAANGIILFFLMADPLKWRWIIERALVWIKRGQIVGIKSNLSLLITDWQHNITNIC